MNKIFSKIATLSVGLAMAVGVGVAVGHVAVKVSAEDDSITFTTSSENVGYSGSGTASNLSMESDGVTLTFSSVTGKTNSPARIQIAKSATITSTEFGGYIKSLTVNNYAHTANSSDGSFTVQGSADGETFVDVEEHTGLSKSAGTVVTSVNVANKYTNFKIVNGSARVMQLSSIVVEYEKQEAKVVKNVTGVHSAPSSCYVGDTITATSVKLDVVFSDNEVGIVTASSVACDTSAPGNVKATASYDEATGVKTAQFDVQVLAVEVESIEKSGTFKTEFSENQAFSFGGGKIIVNKNNGSSETIDPTAEGVSVKIGETDITGITYYIQKSDKDKVVTISYQGKSFTYTIASVSDAIATDGYYQLIKSSSELVVGSNYVIGATAAGVVMGSQADNNRNGVAATISEEKINDLPAGAVVFTLKAGKSEDTYSFYDGAGAGYLYAASSGSNYLRTEVELSDNSSFSLAVDEAGLVTAIAQGTNSRNRMRYNPNNGSPIFSCYGSTSTVGSLVSLYKFVASERTDDQKAVDTFINTYMHLDDVDVNDHTGGNACKGEAGYYAVAKEHYASLTADQKTFFATSEEFRVARARERLAAWAVANGETFNPAEGTFTNIRLNPVNFIGGDTSGFAIIIVISTVSVLAFGLAIMLRKKHR